jgi:cytochrome c oxidase assembly factor CtaG
VPALAVHDVSVSSILGEWHLQAVPVAFTVAAVVVFARAFASVRADDPGAAPWTRAALFAVGIAVMVGPLLSPLHAAGERYLLSAHMLEHVLLADAGPALLVLAVRGPICHALRPRIRWLAPAVEVCLHPWVALAAWVGVIGVWHVPALYDRALTHPRLHDLEHASFAVVGTMVWVLLIDPGGRARLSLSGRLAFVVALFFAGQALSDVLVFSFRAYYPAYADATGRLLGLSALTDQRLAGIVMALEQLATLGTCFVVLLRRLRRRGVAHPALDRV